MRPLPKDKPEDEKESEDESSAQNIPEEVLKQLPPEVKAQLGYVEEQKPIFQSASGNTGLAGSIDRLREGIEKIGLTLIGRMGEFASTLERVVMTVSRIDKVEKSTAETTYFLKNLQKTLEDFKRDFNKIVDKVDNLSLLTEKMSTELEGLRQNVATGYPTQAVPPAPVRPIAQPVAIVQSSEIKPLFPQPPISQPLPQPALSTSTPEPPAIIHSLSKKPLSNTPMAAKPVASPPPPAKSSDNPTITLIYNIQAQMLIEANPAYAADLLDQVRETISKQSKWTPAVYEIGKLARKLRKAGTPISQTDLNEINTILEQCKSQIAQNQ